MCLADAHISKESGGDRDVENAVVRAAIAGYKEAGLIIRRNGIDKPTDR